MSRATAALLAKLCDRVIIMDTTITIDSAPEPTDDVRTLIEELDRELAAEYSPQQRHGLEAIFQPHIRFFLARSNGLAAGCGGVAFRGDFAEVKRMYVRDGARGRGLANALLARIKRETLDAGITTLRLETGTRQFAALRFYERNGFRPCAAFGSYRLMAPHAIAASVFLEKRLNSDAA